LDEKYELFLGKEKIASPGYDLKYFTNKIPKTMEVIKTGSMVMLSATVKHDMPDFFNKKTIWIALILVIALLFWMTLKITREMRT
jgi:cell division protein FtsW (lipid II flippase)